MACARVQWNIRIDEALLLSWRRGRGWEAWVRRQHSMAPSSHVFVYSAFEEELGLPITQLSMWMRFVNVNAETFEKPFFSRQIAQSHNHLILLPRVWLTHSRSSRCFVALWQIRMQFHPPAYRRRITEVVLVLVTLIVHRLFPPPLFVCGSVWQSSV